MNVTIIGSYRNDSRLLLTLEQFRKACAHIGGKLALWGHRLIVPNANDLDNAETHALAGFVLAGSNQYIKCRLGHGDPELKAHFDAVARSDAVILVGGRNGTYAAGLVGLRHRKVVIPIPAFGGSATELCALPDVTPFLSDDIRNLDVEAPNWLNELSKALDASLNAFPRALIIHGRGDSGLALKQQIQSSSLEDCSALRGIAAPVVMNLRGKGALLVPDVFEQLAASVSAAIAIITADDVGGFARSDSPTQTDFSARELRLSPRARENIWVEVGWFWGRLGRHRVLLWLKEDVDLPSDLQGTAWVRGTLDEAWPSIEAFLITLRKPPSGSSSP